MSDAALLLPECVLTTGILGALLAEAMGLRARVAAWLVWAGACFALAALAALWPGSQVVGHMVRDDGLLALARLGILGAALAVLAAGPDDRRDHGAWAVCVGSLALGGMMTAAATHLIALLVGLELLSLSAYALAGWRNRGTGGAEAGMKYVLYGGAASGVMVFGMAHLFGLTGHLDLAGIGAAAAGGIDAALAAALVLTGAGLAVKLAVVPAHLIAPDVYQGATPRAVAALGTIPKIGAVAAAVRVLDGVLPASAWAQAGPFLATVGAVSLVVAAVTALTARHAGRLVAFSAIGHAGALVLALAAGPGGGAVAVYYLVAYVPALLTALFALAALEERCGSLALGDLDGAARRHPWLVAVLGLALASLLGLPPLPGFFAKWWVLNGLLAGDEGWRSAAAVVLVVSTVVSAWAYLLILRACLLRDSPAQEPPARPGPDQRWLLALGAAVLVVLMAWPDAVLAIRTVLGHP